MNLRSQLRSLLIHGAASARADRMWLHLQNGGRHRRAVVVEMHETPRAFQKQFCQQLSWVSEHFEILSPEKFFERLRNPEASQHEKTPILFTFDDGRESNYHVAAPLLESFGARGVFFIVPDFAECSNGQALAFYRSRINPEYRSGGNENEEDWRPMNRAQIAELAKRGHTIGNHTLTHVRLAGFSPEALEKEIGESARKLASWTGTPVETFAWTFGSDAIDANALNVVRRHHRFCFAACGGCIDAHSDTPQLLWRREVEVKYSPAEYRFLYSGLADFWWMRRRARLRKMFKASKNE